MALLYSEWYSIPTINFRTFSLCQENPLIINPQTLILLTPKATTKPTSVYRFACYGQFTYVDSHNMGPL